MRRLVSLVLVIVVVLPALPASAKPTATDLVTWTTGEGAEVTLDTSANMVSVSIESEVWVECAGAGAFAKAELQGTASPDVTLDRHGRSGSFSAETIELEPTNIVGGCGDYAGSTLTTSVSGTFETFKGKAERWREGGDRFIERQGFGTVSVHSLRNEPTDVTATRKISR